MNTYMDNSVRIVGVNDRKKLRKRYNKFVIINLEKRAFLRNLIRRNTRCEHKQIYTQANAICRRISSSYEEEKISAKQAMDWMMEAHDKMSHRNLPKDVICDEMNKRLNKLDKVEKTLTFETTMANVSVSNRIKNHRNE
ncbi:MAG: hypothetical protein EHM25_11125 [Nitrosopumilales archaeon]|nr:MAG: hypothetical protein EHM25_11125 [Nitrosopumilales archaeon]